MPYTLSKKELTNLKRARTRAEKTGDPEKIIAEVNRAFGIFDEKGWPDNWSDWQRAKNDAEMKLAYS